jgi:hypothetical protein
MEPRFGEQADSVFVEDCEALIVGVELHALTVRYLAEDADLLK